MNLFPLNLDKLQYFWDWSTQFYIYFRINISIKLCLILEVSEFTDDNASTTEADENKVSEEIEEIEDEEGIDGVSSEGEKTSGGTETAEVNNLLKIPRRFDIQLKIFCF